MNLDDIKAGDRVVFIPRHAHGDRTHRDCETGTVSSTNRTYAFVRFDPQMPINGPSEACFPHDLECINDFEI